jgi:predicted 3-demethylubiquinone-9 3-methyltransferase (glyoxalase superfamily)
MANEKIIPFLWFNGNAEEAVNFYVSIFKQSKITNVSRYGEAGPGEPGAAMVVEFELEGQDFMAINGGDAEQNPGGPYPGSVALYVDCETQADVDRVYDALSHGGRELQCGWVSDKYGVTWNIVPSGLQKYIGGDDPERSQRAMQAMLQMQKLDINELKRAYEGV